MKDAVVFILQTVTERLWGLLFSPEEIERIQMNLSETI